MARGAVPGLRRGTTYRGRGLEPGRHRGLPSTTLTVIVSLDGPVSTVRDASAPWAPRDARADLVLAGMHTTPVLLEQPSTQEGIQLQIDPLAARALFGRRAADLVGSFDATDVLGRAGQDLWEQVGSMTEWPRRIDHIARTFRSWSTDGRPAAGSVRPEVAEAWRLVMASRGRITMDALAHRVALSPRQLRTEFAREVGIGPKSASRLVRFETALERIAATVHAGRTPHLATVAADSGFSDHAHLTRDFHRFTGTSPTRWIHEERRNLQAGGHGTVQD